MVKAAVNAESAELGMKHDANTYEADQETSTSRLCQLKMQSNKSMRKVVSMLRHPLILNQVAKKMIEM